MGRIEMKDDPLYKVLQIYSNDFMSFDSFLWPHMALLSIYFQHMFIAYTIIEINLLVGIFFYFRKYHTLVNENFVK